jgi:hypothetical protein
VLVVTEIVRTARSLSGIVEFVEKHDVLLFFATAGFFPGIFAMK